ncbi:hypothetical protein LshimejAT787_0400710 [Lyophyllum shimeji]|uniref:Uncharacterized protein n=1 Tax=Lyophyllum shimeji TaxID=47721 RepID=A0A9P3PIW2_LYOSH|nr:hypothetical protein LshimejAT787_0400710 [Lyophyllum shimeji]
MGPQHTHPRGLVRLEWLRRRPGYYVLHEVSLTAPLTPPTYRSRTCCLGVRSGRSTLGGQDEENCREEVGFGKHGEDELSNKHPLAGSVLIAGEDLQPCWRPYSPSRRKISIT